MGPDLTDQDRGTLAYLVAMYGVGGVMRAMQAHCAEMALRHSADWKTRDQATEWSIQDRRLQNVLQRML